MISFTSWLSSTELMFNSASPWLVRSGWVSKHSSSGSDQIHMTIRQVFLSLSSFTLLRTYPELTDGLIVAVCELHSDLHDVPVLIAPDHASGLPGVSADVTRVIIRHVTSALIIILATGGNEALPESCDNKFVLTLMIYFDLHIESRDGGWRSLPCP